MGASARPPLWWMAQMVELAREMAGLSEGPVLVEDRAGTVTLPAIQLHVSVTDTPEAIVGSIRERVREAADARALRRENGAAHNVPAPAGTFAEALDSLRAGWALRRAAWSRERFVRLAKAHVPLPDGRTARVVDMLVTDAGLAWQCRQDDLLARDWEVCAAEAVADRVPAGGDRAAFADPYPKQQPASVLG